MGVLRRCPLAIAQRLVHCAIALSTAVLDRSLRQRPLHRCWRTTWTTQSKRRPTCSAQLHLPTHDLFWAKVRVQLHLPPLRSLDLLISPGTLSCFQNSMACYTCALFTLHWYLDSPLPCIRRWVCKQALTGCHLESCEGSILSVLM